MPPQDLIDDLKKDKNLKVARITEIGYQGITINVGKSEQAQKNLHRARLRRRIEVDENVAAEDDVELARRRRLVGDIARLEADLLCNRSWRDANVKAGDEVITTPVSAAYTALAVMMSGARPVL